MKKIILLFHFTFCVFHFTFAQTVPAIQWQNTIGGNEYEELYSMQQTSDGGYIIAGPSISVISGDKTENCLGHEDYWVVKLDSTGNIQWQNTIGGDNNDLLFSIAQTPDGGYVCGGTSASGITFDKTDSCFGYPEPDYWIVKLDPVGNILWQKTLGGTEVDWLHSIAPTADGGCICGGFSSSPVSGNKTVGTQGAADYWVVKLDSTGNIQWQNAFGGSDGDLLYSLSQTADGGYICGGISISPASGDKTEGNWDPTLITEDIWIVKLTPSGTIQWQNTIGGSGSDLLNTILETPDGGYICAGSSNSNVSGDKTENNLGSGTTSDCWIVKLDSTGTIQWDNTIGGNLEDMMISVSLTSDGGYICGGPSGSGISGDKTQNSQGGYDYWILKLNATGNIQWQKTIGGNLTDVVRYVAETSDNGFICGGSSTSPISGDKTEINQGYLDYWIVKLFPDTITGTTNIQSSINNIQLFPNPAKDEITISIPPLWAGQVGLTVFDVMGKQVLSQSITNLNSQIINLKSFPPGLYSVQVSNGTQTAMSRFVKM